MRIGRAGFVLHLEMPQWLRGSPFEAGARSFAHSVKNLSRLIEKSLRRDKVWAKLPSIEKGMWLDYDFAVRHSFPDEDPMLEAFVAALKPGDVVYDVGSFVGWYAIPAADEVGPQGAVVAFEPVPDTAQVLRKHLGLNMVADRIRLVEAACSNTTGEVFMPVHSIKETNLASGNGLLDVHPQKDLKADMIPVSTLRLDDFWRGSDRAPNILKIDVEGAELWVLEGAEVILRKARPLVFMELHEFAWKWFGTTEKSLRAFLKSVSYDLLELSSPHDPIPVIPERGYALLAPKSRRNRAPHSRNATIRSSD